MYYNFHENVLVWASCWLLLQGIFSSLVTSPDCTEKFLILNFWPQYDDTNPTISQNLSQFITDWYIKERIYLFFQIVDLTTVFILTKCPFVGNIIFCQHCRSPIGLPSRCVSIHVLIQYRNLLHAHSVCVCINKHIYIYIHLFNMVIDLLVKYFICLPHMDFLFFYEFSFTICGYEDAVILTFFQKMENTKQSWMTNVNLRNIL